MTRTPLRRTTAALATLLLAGTLAACGDVEPTAAPTDGTTSAAPSASPTEPADESPSEPATDGDRIEGQGYSYGLPEGWEDGTERFQAMSPLLDTGALDSDASAGFADNVNVIRNDTYPEMTLEEAEQQFAEEARTVSEQVRVREQSEIGGETAIHISGRTAMGNEKVRTEQYSLYQDGAWYVVTFSFAQQTSDAEADMGTVLGSWEWS